MICPTHQTPLSATVTRYGLRRQCDEPGCTVACWDGKTSTPADAETRSLRHACHEAFDPLWKTKTRWRSRRAAYAWLQRFMGLSEGEAHIGMFDAGQCRQLLAEVTGDQYP